MLWTEATIEAPTDRTGHENHREDCRWSHKTGGPAAAGEMPSSEQEALYGLCGPRESI